MAITDARKSADADGVRKVEAVFVRFPRQGGKFKYNRQPFNFVVYEWGNGERKTYMEICPGNQFKSLGQGTTVLPGDVVEQYDDIKILDPQELNSLPSIDRADK